MTDGKRKRSKRDGRHSTRGDAPSKPTPIELISFCKEAGIDLFDAELRARVDQIKTEEDYSKLVKDWSKRGGRADRLRLALNLWADVVKVAADVIEEVRTPPEFAQDARMNFRWRRSSKVPVPQSVRDDAELQWQIACNEGEHMSRRAAQEATRFKTEGRMQEALRDFGCPSKLASRLTSYAVEQLRWLDKKWVRAQNRARSAKRRASKSQRKKSA
jgi:hypothetical protein